MYVTKYTTKPSLISLLLLNFDEIFWEHLNHTNVTLANYFDYLYDTKCFSLYWYNSNSNLSIKSYTNQVISYEMLGLCLRNL